VSAGDDEFAFSNSYPNCGMRALRNQQDAELSRSTMLVGQSSADGGRADSVPSAADDPLVSSKDCVVDAKPSRSTAKVVPRLAGRWISSALIHKDNPLPKVRFGFSYKFIIGLTKFTLLNYK